MRAHPPLSIMPVPDLIDSSISAEEHRQLPCKAKMSRTLVLLLSNKNNNNNNKNLTIIIMIIIGGAAFNWPARPKCHALSSTSAPLQLLNKNNNNNSSNNNTFKPMTDPSPGIIVVTVSLSSSSLEPLRRLTGLGPFEDNDEEIFFLNSAQMQIIIKLTGV